MGTAVFGGVSLGEEPTIEPTATQSSDTICLCLPTTQSVVADLSRALSAMGVSMLTDAPTTSIADLQAFVAQNHPAFCVAYVKAEDANLQLSSLLGIQHVAAPPLLAVVEGKTNPAMRELLRKAGVAHITRFPLEADRDRAAIDALRRSPSWFSTSVAQMGVRGVAELMATHQLSGMVSVACECLSSFRDDSWNQSGPFRCIDDSLPSCEGFHGRLYIRAGRLVHAESPIALGKRAIGQMEQVRRGTVRVHEVFIKPMVAGRPPPIPKPTIESNSQLVDNLTEQQDESGAQGASSESEARMSKGELSSTLDMQVAGEEARQTMKAGMNTLLKVAPNLQVAAKSDSGGNVIEVAGDGDGESVCAVTAMCSNPVIRIAELLGLGSPEGWSIVTEKIALYVQQDGDTFVSVLGNSNKNPDQILTKLAKTYQNSAAK